MTSKVAKRVAIVTGLVLLLVGFAAVAYAGNSWSGYHWDISTADSTADPLDLGDNLNTFEWGQSLNGASSDWNVLNGIDSVLNNEVVPGTSNANCDPTSGLVEVCNGDYGDNGWLGIAQVWVKRGRSGHILQGVVKVNDTYFNTPKYNTQPWRDFVMCQEVGHTLGLDHQDTNFGNANLGTCMDYTDNPSRDDGNGSNLQPNADDYATMENVYAHLNSTDGGSGPGGGNGRGKKPKGVGADIDLNNPTAWGQAIRVDAQGNGSLYERHLANGETLFTFVTWVD